MRSIPAGSWSGSPITIRCSPKPRSAPRRVMPKSAARTGRITAGRTGATGFTKRASRARSTPAAVLERHGEQRDLHRTGAPPAEASGTACIPLSPVHDVSGSGRAARGARRPVAVVGPPHRAGLVSPRRLPRQPVRDAGGRGACHGRAVNGYEARRTDPAAHPPPVLWILLLARELLLLLCSQVPP